MRVRWTPSAADDLTDFVGFLRRDHESAARRLAEAVLDATASLARFPLLGREVDAAGTRELILAPHRYLIVYRVVDGTVEVLRIRHGAHGTTN